MEKSFGFTLIEILIIVGIFIILIFLSAQVFPYFQKEVTLNNSAEEIINNLRLAQNKTLASEGASQYGVYFDTSTNPHQYTLFKGVNYANRVISQDEVHKLSKIIEIYENTLAGSEVVFNRLNGESSQTGKISIRLKDTPSRFKTVSIQASGNIILGEETSPSDNSRVKDSRHVHFDYSRAIDTLTETITLTFFYDSSTVTQDIVIQNNMEGGQIFWEGEVNVNGQNQRIKIHSHRLNNPDTLFSVHRDRRFNDRALRITISGDASGNLIEYSADGLTTTSTSFFVSNRLWQ